MKLNCIYPDQNESNDIKLSPFNIELKNRTGESKNTNRLIIEGERISIELLPSKGLSVGEAFIDNRPISWEPPIALPNPEETDLNGSNILINGEALPGFDYLETFMGGIEFYGMKNWGMPIESEDKLQPLHGETSNIPVNEIEIEQKENGIEISGEFQYYSMNNHNNQTWYKSGEKLYEIIQSLYIPNNQNSFSFKTTIKNISGKTQVPDWGYHITFLPEEGSKLLIPSKQTELRGGGKLPNDIETWYPAKNNNIRTETGFIHKELPDKDGKSFILMKYTDGTGIKLTFPASPYFQTWFCNGGANSKEFTYRDGTPLFQKNWDGQGVEIGSSALDHDGNIDRLVSYKKELENGETREIELNFEYLNKNACSYLEKVIQNYNKNRNN